MSGCSLVDFCVCLGGWRALAPHRELQTRLQQTPSLPPPQAPALICPPTRLQSARCPHRDRAPSPVPCAPRFPRAAPRNAFQRPIATQVLLTTLPAMSDDATASASAQDSALAGEGATDVSALDQGTSQLFARAPLHASPTASATRTWTILHTTMPAAISPIL